MACSVHPICAAIIEIIKLCSAINEIIKLCSAINEINKLCSASQRCIQNLFIKPTSNE